MVFGIEFGDFTGKVCREVIDCAGEYLKFIPGVYMQAFCQIATGYFFFAVTVICWMGWICRRASRTPSKIAVKPPMKSALKIAWRI